MNRPNPFGPNRRRDDREPMLMDISTAKPSNDVNWEAIVAKTQRGKVDPFKHIYDTSSYLQRVREEDLWPEQLEEMSKGAVRIQFCRIVTPAPVSLDKEIQIEVGVDVTGELVGNDRFLEVQLYDMFREPEADTCGMVGESVSLSLKPGMGQTLRCFVRHPGIKWGELHKPEAHVYVRAEAIHKSHKQLKVSDPVPTRFKKPSALRVRLTGLVFDANKCFLMPEAFDALRAVVQEQHKAPQGQLVVVGHAESDEDLAGPDLAVDRAKAVAAMLTNRWSQWLPWFAPEVPARQRWGIREVQLMMGQLGHYQGFAAGVMDAPTEAALRAFQKSKSLPESGKVDSTTRKNLLSAYFGQPGTTLPKDVEPLAVGAEGLSKQDSLSDPRCLEVLVWADEAPNAPQAGTVAGHGAYEEWCQKLRETREFPVDGLHFHLMDGEGSPMAGGKVMLSGPSSHEVVADAHGWVTVRGLAAGKYRVQIVTPDGRKLPKSEITYPTAKTVTHEVKRDAEVKPEVAAVADSPAPASDPALDTKPADSPSEG